MLFFKGGDGYGGLILGIRWFPGQVLIGTKHLMTDGCGKGILHKAEVADVADGYVFTSKFDFILEPGVKLSPNSVPVVCPSLEVCHTPYASINPLLVTPEYPAARFFTSANSDHTLMPVYGSR